MTLQAMVINELFPMYIFFFLKTSHKDDIENLITGKG
jgi:hypothetical protein